MQPAPARALLPLQLRQPVCAAGKVLSLFMLQKHFQNVTLLWITEAQPVSKTVAA